MCKDQFSLLTNLQILVDDAVAMKPTQPLILLKINSLLTEARIALASGRYEEANRLYNHARGLFDSELIA
jgi:hypothetical protein